MIHTQENSQFLHANGQDYRIVDVAEFDRASQVLVDAIAPLREKGDITAHQAVTIHIIASSEQRRIELLKLMRGKADPSKKINVCSDIFPFDFHSYRYRGRTVMMIVIDELIAEAYFDGHDSRIQTNHQATLNRSLVTMCHTLNKAYCELYFIVKKDEPESTPAVDD